jgi:hypothetical protein
MSSRTILSLAFLLAVMPASVSAQVLVSMTSRDAFLRLDPSDTALGARIVTLADHGFIPGHLLRFETLGDYDNGPGGDTFNGVMVVFSSNSTLLGPTLLARVPGAIDAGTDHVTIPTCPGNLATDIPQDFTIPLEGVEVQIPPGATHVFLATRDCLYRDNSDPDGDFSVRLEDVTVDAPESIDGAVLGIPHPNPARERVTIPIALRMPARVQITVHAVNGNRIRVLEDGTLPVGVRRLDWDGHDDAGSRVATGVYFIRFATAERTFQRRVVMLTDRR